MSMMRVVAAVLAIGAAVAGFAQESSSGGGKPKEFPKVAFEAGSQPRYAALGMDSWTGTTAYVVLDGTRSNGYSRMYVWIPGDRQYGKPVELRMLSEGNVFAPIERKDANEEEKSEIRWRVGHARRGRSAGSETYVDYATGQTRTRSWGASSGFVIVFNVDFAHGDRHALPGMSGGLPVDLTLRGDLPTYESWEKVPASGFAPWTRLSMHLAHRVADGRNRDMAQVSLRYAGMHTGVGSCTVRSMPLNQDVVVTVTPYLEPPAYSNVVSLAELTQKGVDMEIPYGWYTFRVTGFQLGKFRHGVGIPSLGNISPHPIGRAGDGP